MHRAELLRGAAWSCSCAASGVENSNRTMSRGIMCALLFILRKPYGSVLRTIRPLTIVSAD